MRHLRRYIAFSSEVDTGSREENASNKRALRPGALFLELGLIGVDRGLLLHRQPDVVEAVDEAVLAERIDLELHLAAVGTADLLVRQVDRQRRIGAALGVVKQLVEVFLADTDRQNAVLEAVVVE